MYIFVSLFSTEEVLQASPNERDDEARQDGLKDAICCDESVQLFANSPIAGTEPHEIHKIEDKIITLPKANTTPVTVEKKILVTRVGSKGPRRATFCSGLVGHSAPEIQAFLMDTIIVMPAIPLLQIFLRFNNEIQHPQSLFRKPIQPATYPVKKNVTTYTPSASDKAIYLPRKLQHAFEMTRVLVEGWKVTLSGVESQVNSHIIQFFSRASVKDSTRVRPITYLGCNIWKNLLSLF